MYSHLGAGWQTVMMAKAYQAEQLRAADESRIAAQLRTRRPRRRGQSRGILATLAPRARRSRSAVPKMS